MGQFERFLPQLTDLTVPGIDVFTSLCVLRNNKNNNNNNMVSLRDETHLLAQVVVKAKRCWTFRKS